MQVYGLLDFQNRDFDDEEETDFNELFQSALESGKTEALHQIAFDFASLACIHSQVTKHSHVGFGGGGRGQKEKEVTVREEGVSLRHHFSGTGDHYRVRCGEQAQNSQVVGCRRNRGTHQKGCHPKSHSRANFSIGGSILFSFS